MGWLKDPTGERPANCKKTAGYVRQTTIRSLCVSRSLGERRLFPANLLRQRYVLEPLNSQRYRMAARLAFVLWGKFRVIVVYRLVAAGRQAGWLAGSLASPLMCRPLTEDRENINIGQARYQDMRNILSNLSLAFELMTAGKGIFRVFSGDTREDSRVADAALTSPVCAVEDTLRRVLL